MEDREGDNVFIEPCAMTEDVQKDLLTDLVAQLTVDKESEHVEWNDNAIFQEYRSRFPDSDMDGSQPQRNIAQAKRLLSLFVVAPRISSEMLLTILRFKETEYDPLRYL